ncbi:MAG: ABC transporter substrate-binding protein [Clostridiales bacterium]|nr:ABC transporter substrate-binding protein [Clostridiales bacterium]
MESYVHTQIEAGGWKAMAKRLMGALGGFFLALMLVTGALADGVTLRTVSCFAGRDASAEAYVELLKAFETQTGNIVEDASATSDEAWKAGVLYDFAAGNEPDILFFFAASADSAPILSRVVPISEINAAYPNLHLAENASLAEADGKVYAIPSRPFWEGLFVNVDLFERYGLALPTTWDNLEAAIVRFNQEGIIPISASLSDIPHYIAEFAILACGTPQDYTARPKALEDVPDSWYEGMRLIRRLYELNAFASNINATTELAMSQLFREKKAAMQIDGSWFANTIPAQSMDTTIVMPMPTYCEGADPTAVVGGVSMGFYLTRSAWEDETRRDAAVALLSWLTNTEAAAKLGGYHYSGRLLESSYQLTSHASCMLSPLQDAMTKEAREVWLLECISRVADGSMSAEACWETVMALHPFGE